ncbi:Lrp/AsnC family transcriptional regulator [Roseivivax isoporae]|uniref:AsnC family transcriptional regulator n=1 Tax=Roseivivax isoporae LMG 25204 TaxID=1449351 RepID=X7FDG8_9RHOB|nr:Lrp/AsnC family transcriptional regulator [Roseivivax isoporae]ETX30079.1 AsnC family transcriptional regulator [Roseivivax isoporae LMG 25204]
MELDERDRRLLALIERDCRASHAELAAAVGMSTSACWRRIRAFEEAGVIERYGAVLNPEAMGQAFHAIVHVQLTRHDPGALKGFLSGVAARPEVRECYATTGQADYHLRVRTTDIAAYNRFLEEFLFALPAVRAAQTNVVLRDLKR